ncbi:IclR family transcriptional regulator [Microvirga sp. W0021]|uniref:IclR family transcriptional regulator n=1 Tax=Hohaiivirga grylli TaxID=3133970 RepID=A0ABV0BIQ0_9HYPH
MSIPAPALKKGFDILDLVSRQPGIGFTEIRNTLSLPKSSAHVLLRSLSEIGALAQQPDGGYVLGLRLFELGSIAAAQRNISDVAVPYLRQLAHEVQLTCHLGVREGDEAVYLAKLECQQPIRISSWAGKRVSLHSSSLGKALLAWMPEYELDEILSRFEWVQKLPKTIQDISAYKQCLAKVREQGWAIDDEEDVRNLRCLGAPIRDMNGNIVAAISAAGTTFQIDDNRIASLASRLLEVAHEISGALGFSGYHPDR